MSDKVYDRFADGEVKAFATKKDVPPHKFAGRFLRKMFPMLASSVMLFSSVGCSSNRTLVDDDGCVNCVELTDDQIYKLMTEPKTVILKDTDFNHAPKNDKNYWNVVHQGLEIIDDLPNSSNLSDKEILDYKRTAVEMLVDIKVADGNMSKPNLSDDDALKSFLFFEKVVKYRDNYDKVFASEDGVYNEQSALLGRSYIDSYRLIEKARKSKGVRRLVDEIYRDGRRFLIDKEDEEYANEISRFILKEWLKKNGIEDDKLYKIAYADKDSDANTLSFYYKQGKDFRAEIKIDPTGDLGRDYYSPVGVNVIHELLHVTQKKPSSDQKLSEKDLIIQELGPTLNSLMLEDMIYKTIHKIPINNVVDYGNLEIGEAKISYGELAVWFRKMTDKYPHHSIDKLLCEDEVFSKLEKIGNGENVNLLPSPKLAKSIDYGR